MKESSAQAAKNSDKVTQLKPLPYNLESEIALLGAMILRPATVVPMVKEQADETVFYLPDHKTLTRALFDLNEKFDFSTLTVWCKENDRDVNKIRTLASQITDQVSTAAQAAYHLTVIKGLYARRQLIQACRRAEGALHDLTVPMDEVLEDYKTSVLQAEESRTEPYRTSKQLVDEIWADLERRSQSGETNVGVLTGFLSIDEKTGGMEPGCTYYLKGQSHSGKSALALNISDNIAQDHPTRTVLYITLESQDIILMRRRMAKHSGVSLTRLRRAKIYNDGEWEDVLRAANLCSADNFILADDTAFSNLNRLSGFCESMALRADISLVVVDHLQLMYLPGKWSTTHHEYKEISRRLNHLAKKLKVPLLILSQVNKEGDAKESRDIYANADNEWKLEREKDSGAAQLVCTKGKDSGLWQVDLRFDGHFMRFSDG